MLRFCLWAFLSLPALLQAAITLRVNASYSLDSAGRNIADTRNEQVHEVIFEQFSQLGTFTIPSNNTSLSDTVIFKTDENVTQGIQLNAQPLLNVQGFKSPIVMKGLNFEITNNKASLSIGVADTNHSLILRDCNFYGTDLSHANFLNWRGRTGSKILFERCFFGIRTNLDSSAGGITRMNLIADTVMFSNTNFNLMGRAEITANKHFHMRQSTVNRFVFNLNGLPGVTARIYKNLFAFTNPTNVVTGSAIRYAIYPTPVVTAFTGLETNKRYAAWSGVVFPSSQNEYVDNSVVVSPLPGKDVSELWNWYSDIGADSVGIGHGSDRGVRYSVFPGTTQAGLRYQGDSVRLSFRSSLFPRSLVISLGGAIPQDSLHDMRYVWPNRSAVSFGNFQIDSIEILGGTARHGSPVLLSQITYDGPFTIQNTYGTRFSPRTFKNEDLRARFFHPAFKSVIPRGLNVAINASPDSLIFTRVDIAGHPTYSEATPSQTENLLPSTRYLGKSILIKTTAILRDSLRYGTLRSLQHVPLFPDSIAWLSIDGTSRTLLKNRTNPNGMNWVTAPVGDSNWLVMVEHLSIPISTQTLVRPTYSIYTNSRFGFQLIDDVAPVPSAELYDKVSTAVSLRMIGRGLQDSVVVEFFPQDTVYTAQWVVNGVVDTLRSALDTQSGKVRVLLGSMDTVGTLFLGRRLNIRANTVFNGLVSGLQVNGFLSKTSGMLSASPISEKVLYGDELFLNNRFIKGWALTAEKAGASGFSISDNLGSIIDAGAIRAFVRTSPTSPWTLVSLSLSTTSMGAATVDGLTLNDGRIELVFLEALATLRTTPQVAVQAIGAENNVIRFTQRADANLPNATHFQIEVRSVDLNGFALVDASSRVPIDSTINFTLANNRIANYLVKIFAGERLIANRVVETLPGHFNLDLIATHQETFAPMRWHLVSVPAGVTGLTDTTWMRRLGRQSQYRDSVEVQTIEGLGFRKQPLNTPRNPGEGLLIISTDSMKLTWTAAQVPPLGRLIITGPVGGGWKLVGHPFPYYIPAEAILSNQLFLSPSVPISSFYELRRSGNQLSWGPVKGLSQHLGYAYRFNADEKLSLNPFLFDAGLPKSAANPLPRRDANAPNLPHLVFSEAHSQQTLWVVPGGTGRDDLPYLPVPGQATDLRLGNAKGFMKKAIQARGLENLPLAIRSPKPGKAEWKWEAAESGLQAALFDTTLGHFYRSGDTLPLTGATQNWVLSIGTREELEAKQQGWKNRDPSRLRFQAPWVVQGRQPMQVSFDWPSLMAQGRGILKITLTDSRGRVHGRETLKPDRVGFQTHNLPKPDATGQYVISVTAQSDALSVSWQQKCTVLP